MVYAILSRLAIAAKLLLMSSILGVLSILLTRKAHHAAELSIANTAFFYDSAILTKLLIERIHGLICKVFKLKVWEQ